MNNRRIRSAGRSSKRPPSNLAFRWFRHLRWRHEVGGQPLRHRLPSRLRHPLRFRRRSRRRPQPWRARLRLHPCRPRRHLRRRTRNPGPARRSRKCRSSLVRSGLPKGPVHVRTGFSWLLPWSSWLRERPGLVSDRFIRPARARPLRAARNRVSRSRLRRPPTRRSRARRRRARPLLRPRRLLRLHRPLHLRHRRCPRRPSPRRRRPSGRPTRSRSSSHHFAR